jgi:hypothetical protein
MSERYQDGWWFPTIKAQVLRKWVFPRVPKSGGIVEVGSWEGKSTCYIARAFPARRIVAIDPFTGGIADGTTALAEHRDVRAEFNRNTDICAPNRIDLWFGGWRDPGALDLVRSRSPLALVYIDGEHTEVEVFDNVLAYAPLMNGIIAGDDWGNREVKRGAIRSARHLGADLRHSCSTWWMEFRQ